MRQSRLLARPNNLEDQIMATPKRIVFLRNQLVLWSRGDTALSLTEVQSYIIELDNLLQWMDA